MLRVRKYFERESCDIVISKAISIKAFGKPDIYTEGQAIDILNLTKPNYISFNKILTGNNSLRCVEKDNKLTLYVYNNTNKKRILKRVGTDNTDRPVLKFNDIWIRISEELFKKLKLNYLHSLNKEYKDLININLDEYRIVIHKTRFGYPDITIYEGGHK